MNNVSAKDNAKNASDPFFVGYLDTPRSLARFLRWIVPGVMVAALGVAWQVSGSQSDPGNGVWHDGESTLVGQILASPYPLIRVKSGRSEGAIETILLVSEGKLGAADRIAALHGQVAKVRGAILERDGRRLLELADGDSISPVESDSASTTDLASHAHQPPVQRRDLGRIVLRGEIIDPKCYSGAMKPGEGKAHKECATLCIAGGIPPMFVALNREGKPEYFLLTNSAGNALEGRALHEELLPFVADAVEISGELELRDDMAIIRVNLSSIRRL